MRPRPSMATGLWMRPRASSGAALAERCAPRGDERRSSNGRTHARPAARFERGGASPMRAQQGLFAVASIWVMACGGTVSPAADSGTTSGGEDGSGPGSAVGASSGTAGSSGGGSSAGPPMSGPSTGGPPTSGDADAGVALPMHRMPMPVADAAVVFPPSDAAVVRCNSNGPGVGGGSGGGGGNGGPASCNGFADETCSGVSYSVSCACPQGTCACQGASSTFVAFAGCPVCPTSAEQMFAACGFPQ